MMLAFVLDQSTRDTLLILIICASVAFPLLKLWADSAKHKRDTQLMKKLVEIVDALVKRL